MTNKIVVGISGSSGVIYGIRLLEVLRDCLEVESHLVISKNAEKNILIETKYTVEAVKALANVTYVHKDMVALISSGSYRIKGMVIAPCSMKTLSSIANSYNDNLISRAADVSLKERRKLVLLPRETPLHKGHLELMVKVADNGAVVLPPMPSFYHSPTCIEDIIDQTIGKVLDQFDIKHNLFKRWGAALLHKDILE